MPVNVRAYFSLIPVTFSAVCNLVLIKRLMNFAEDDEGVSVSAEIIQQGVVIMFFCERRLVT